MSAAALLLGAAIPAPWGQLEPGAAVLFPDPYYWRLIVREDGAVIARVISADPETCHRNAQLIAAAPIMAAGLAIILNTLEDLGEHGEMQKEARGALRQAGLLP